MTLLKNVGNKQHLKMRNFLFNFIKYLKLIKNINLFILILRYVLIQQKKYLLAAGFFLLGE